jgi:hypothetical protein
MLRRIAIIAGIVVGVIVIALVAGVIYMREIFLGAECEGCGVGCRRAGREARAWRVCASG